VLPVPYDKYETAKQIDETMALSTKDDTENIDFFKKLDKENVTLSSII
jgi:hypothetical protein